MKPPLSRTVFSLLSSTLIIGAVITVLVVHRSRTAATPVVKPAAAAGAPRFSFRGTSGWWQGGTNKTSMALFPRTKDCFTSVEQKPGKIDAAAVLQKGEAMLRSEGYTVAASNVVTIILQTNTGQQPYELHQYGVTGIGSAGRLYGAQEFGYLQLTNGYIKIEGYCDTVDELPTTIPALQAITFNEKSD
ncbi:MAG TPA: hypothetical protein VLF69_04410 [Candidatus Saccharimonadales bacterium]|nr:hypothetical protein [Candidatus Saccharimonadales bacterium]